MSLETDAYTAATAIYAGLVADLDIVIHSLLQGNRTDTVRYLPNLASEVDLISLARQADFQAAQQVTRPTLNNADPTTGIVDVVLGQIAYLLIVASDIAAVLRATLTETQRVAQVKAAIHGFITPKTGTTTAPVDTALPTIADATTRNQLDFAAALRKARRTVRYTTAQAASSVGFDHIEYLGLELGAAPLPANSTLQRMGVVLAFTVTPWIVADGVVTP